MSPWITIVIVAYQRYHHLPIMIHSFLTQTNPNWTMVIIHDGPDQRHHDLVAPYVQQFPQIKYHQTKKRYNDYGHSLRQLAIDEFVDTEWVLQTNDDNYYVPTLLESCQNIISSHPSTQMIMYDCLINGVVKNQKFRLPYTQQLSFPAIKYIDMGSFILKTDAMKTTSFTTLFEADGILVESIMANCPKLNPIKINQTLFVHN